MFKVQFPVAIFELQIGRLIQRLLFCWLLPNI